MSFQGRDLLRLGFFVALIVVILLVVWGNVYVTNKLSDENKQPVTITPGSPVRGPKGDKGDSPTPAEVRQAVADYCADSGICAGEAPTPAVVYAAVSRYCLEVGCRGEAGIDGARGQDGKNADPVTDAQIYAQVVTYCAANECRGEAGAPGADGTPGVDGRNPLIACVIRPSGRFIAWKYADEDNTAYRNLYELPPLTDCQNPVDLRGEG